MASTVNRSVRTLGFAAAVTASIPLCLTGCAPAPKAAAPQATELRASAESGFLARPAERQYEIAETTLTEPIALPLGGTVDGELESHGFLVLTDGVITQAQFGLALAGFPEATFVLTEPTVLRPEGSPDGTVTAVGTLSVGGAERPGIRLKLTPTVLGSDSVEFDLNLAVPDNPFYAGEDPSIDEVAAHVVLTAR
ncbi:hypothetical protein [Leucobacter chromiireducens]|uniref:Lipid/polyisoprenoid-binding YceI-like domain-containing protein n=1 Tax=Leucobacter chromiireducens subsp. chromiireducens TaxID=660067 RepID=A0ABS1SLT4_9MICO|nr:hypothetical protein [Leucobacter chromiireducens]MBL3689142.1 hypothetical protein [Leucobacter chromiireducens subsp. chromiireducens]